MSRGRLKRNMYNRTGDVWSSDLLFSRLISPAAGYTSAGPVLSTGNNIRHQLKLASLYRKREKCKDECEIGQNEDASAALSR